MLMQKREAAQERLWGVRSFTPGYDHYHSFRHIRYTQLSHPRDPKAMEGPTVVSLPTNKIASVENDLLPAADPAAVRAFRT